MAALARTNYPVLLTVNNRKASQCARSGCLIVDAGQIEITSHSLQNYVFHIHNLNFRDKTILCLLTFWPTLAANFGQQA